MRQDKRIPRWTFFNRVKDQRGKVVKRKAVIRRRNKKGSK